MQYDGQNNVVFFSDANGPLPQVLPRRTPALGTYIANLHGNVTHFTYDGLSRLKEKRLRLTASGRGDGTETPPLDPNQAGDGYITVSSVWDKNSRLVQQIDDAGNVTEYAYDALDRKLLATYAKGTSAQTSESWVYDGADRLTKTIDQNGTQIGSVYDLASRLISKSLLVQGSTPLVGTLSQTFEWDGLGWLTKASDDNGGVPVLFDRAYDSLGRAYIENQTAGGVPYTTQSFWKGEGLRWNFLFPNGRSMLSTFDNMNRLKTIDGGIGYEYAGQGRVLERSFPNGTALSYRNGLSMLGYDGARRVRAPRHVTTSSGTPNKPMGELYDYDSAYRLIRWDEGWITKSNTTGTTGFVQGRGDFTTSPGQGAFPYTVKVLQDGGYPIGSYSLTIDIQDVRDGQYFRLDGVGNWQQMMRQDIMIGNAVSMQLDHPAVRRALECEIGKVWLRFARTPLASVEEKDGITLVHLMDARYQNRPPAGWAGDSNSS